jgi:hypothetical protein
MYNFLGQEVLYVESNNSEVNISTGLEAGIYSLHICTENNTQIVRKLIIN